MLYVVAFLLVAANTLNIGADIEAMAGSIHLVLPIVPTALAAVLVVALTLTLLVFMSYKTYSKYLKWVALVLFSYMIVAFLSHVDWGLALKSLVVPAIKLDAGYITTLVAILGTTISPYMFFWQANMEVEEKIASGSITSPDPQMKRPRKLVLGRRAMNDMHIDINVGMFYSELIMFFIIVSTASTIYKAGAKDVGQLDLAGIAQVLRPLAGDAAYLLFTLGIVGIGLLAIPVLAGSAAYALSEVFGWEEGLYKKLALRPLAGSWLKGHQNVQAKVRKVAITKATAIEHLDFQVDAFGKTVTMPTIEVVQNTLAPVVERLDKRLQGAQFGGFGLVLPFRQGLVGGLTIRRLVEPGAEVLLQVVARLEFRGGFEHLGQLGPFFVSQLFAVLDEQPAAAFQDALG